MELTNVASHLHTVADTVRAAFGTMRLGDHAIEMTAPEGSTKGGTFTLQHLCLRPTKGTGSAIVIGTVDVLAKKAEIRSFGFVRKMCERRFKQSPSFDAAAYEAFVERAQTVFANFQCDVSVVDPPVEPSVSPPHMDGLTGGRRFARWLLLALAFLALAALALAVARALMRR